MAIDKSKIKPILEGQSGQTVADNIKGNFEYVSDHVSGEEYDIRRLNEYIFTGEIKSRSKPQYTIIKGFIPMAGGGISPSDSYSHTSPIFVSKGKAVIYSYNGWGVSPLAKTDKNGTSYTPIVKDNEVGNTSQKTRYWEADEDVYISACGKTVSGDFSVELGDIKGKSVFNQVNDIKQSVDSISNKKNINPLECEKKENLWPMPSKGVWEEVNQYNGRIYNDVSGECTIQGNKTNKTFIVFTDNKIVAGAPFEEILTLNPNEKKSFKISGNKTLWFSEFSENMNRLPQYIEVYDSILYSKSIVPTPTEYPNEVVAAPFIKGMDIKINDLYNAIYETVPNNIFKQGFFSVEQPPQEYQRKHKCYEVTLNKGDVLTFDYAPVSGATIYSASSKKFPIMSNVADSEDIQSYTYVHQNQKESFRLYGVLKNSIKVNGTSAIIKDLGNLYTVAGVTLISDSKYKYSEKPIKLDKGDKIIVENPASGVSIISLVQSNGLKRAMVCYPLKWVLPEKLEFNINGAASVFFCGNSESKFFIKRSIGGSSSSDNFNINSIELGKEQETDILSTSRNYVLREKEELGKNYFYFSDDCGRTYKKKENTLGQIAFVHFFSNGEVLLCTKKSCYHTSNFDSFLETKIYDYDGSPFVANANHFFRLGNYNSDYHEYNGKEIALWNDYNIEEGWESRVWITDDYGETLRCILKAHESLDVNGDVIHVRHFHRTMIDDRTQSIWVTSGDDDTDCKLIRGDFQDGWKWTVVGASTAYKLGQLDLGSIYANFITDYTDGQRETGMIQCPISSLEDSSKFKYIWKTENREPVSSYYEDEQGNRCIFPDGVGYHTFWYARKNLLFKKISIISDRPNWSPMCHIGANYNGQSIVCAIPGYNVAALSLSQLPRYLFSEGMHKAGVSDYGMPININL